MLLVFVTSCSLVIFSVLLSLIVCSSNSNFFDPDIILVICTGKNVVKILFMAALSRHYNAKMSFEHQLPTASQKLKVTDECVLAAVVSLVTCTSKVR